MMKPKKAAKTVNASAPSEFKSAAVSGQTTRRDAITSEPNVNASPPTPATPKPGITKISAAMNNNPTINNVTSNQPAVPPRKRLQKNSPKHSVDVSPPIPMPGAPSSMTSATMPISSNRNVTMPEFKTSVSVSVQSRRMTLMGD